jgi:hypothetical protein
VYSQFKTAEGLGVLGIALKANGYNEIVIEGSDTSPRFSNDTIISLQKGPTEKRFITFTGEGSREKRNVILNVFNGNFDKLSENMRGVLIQAGYGIRKNNYGEICWVIGITAAGAEGISLKCCRSVHIMEPYWNNVRLDQVKGRAIRICSHRDLPFKEREVEIYTYVSVFSTLQKNNKKIDENIINADGNQTSDEKVYEVSIKKDKINLEILNLMKASAVDCGLNSADNLEVSCMVVDGKPDQYIFDPDIEYDTLLTSFELKQNDTSMRNNSRTGKSLEQSLGKHKAMRSQSAIIDRFKVIKYKGIEYFIIPDASGLEYTMYLMTDKEHKNPVGTIMTNPATGTLRGSVPTLK